jgi:hypothetical protein
LEAKTAAAVKAAGASWTSEVNWWLLLLGPLGVAGCVAHSRFDKEGFIQLQFMLERPAPYLVGLAAILYIIRTAVTRNPLHMLLAALTVSFTMREFHFFGTGRGIYVALAIIVVWGVLWRDRIADPLTDWRHTSWLIATFAVYLLSQIIARRAFRGIPGEHEIHRPLEECVETIAHLMFIVTALMGSWRRANRS